MTFAEMALSFDESTADITDILERCSAFAEANYNEFETNLKEAELKVIKESGTTEDLVYLKEAASEGYLVRAKNTLKKIAKAIADFFVKIGQAIKSFFSNEKNASAIEKAEKAFKENPKLGQTKVKINDNKAVDSVIKKHESELNRKVAQIKAGKFNQNTGKELDNIQKSFVKEHAKAITATLVISGVAAFEILQSCKKDAKPSNGYAVDVIDLNEETTPEQIGHLIHADRIRAAIDKEKGNAITRTMKAAWNGIKGVANQKRQVKIDDVKESAEDDIIDVSVSGPEITEEPVQESLDTNAILESILQDVEESVKMESFDDESEEGELMTTEEYLESLEAEIFPEDNELMQESAIDDEFNAGAYLEAMESVLFDDGDEAVEESADDDGLVTAEEYLEAMESVLFGDDEEAVEESADDDELVTAEEYLEAMESVLFGDDEEAVEEMTVEEKLAEIEASLME